MSAIVADPIPWAAPLTQAQHALKRAEDKFLAHDPAGAIAALKDAEEAVRYSRYCAEQRT